MSRVWAIAAKELRSYLVSPVAWLAATLFLAITGWMFYSFLSLYSLRSFQLAQVQGSSEQLAQLNVNRLVFEPTFHNMAVTLLLLAPILTMRLLAEEKRNRTAPLLFSSPVRLGEIVAGKYAAAVGLLAVVLLGTGYMPLAVATYGSLDWGPVLTGYAGLLLLTGAYVGLGLLASSLTENPVVAALLSFGLLLSLWTVGWAGQAAGPEGGRLLKSLSLPDHMDGFLHGAVELRDVVYYLSLAALGLFLTRRVLASTRWE